MGNQQKQQLTEANGNNQWQLNYKTIGESMGYYFMNEDEADIWFVPLLNAANPPKKFPGHKFILKVRSPVLHAQFRFDDQTKERAAEKNENGEIVDATTAQVKNKKPKMDLSTDNGNQAETIELVDVEPEAFEQFLRFCYTDNAEINGENATSIFYIANRYTVKPLIERTLKFLIENIKPENACQMLQFATKFYYEGLESVEKKALEEIREKTAEVLKTKAFLEIDSDTLQLIVSQDSLAIKEIALFKALIRWGKEKQKNADNHGKSLREIIQPALIHIEFWQMDFWTVGRFVVPANVLTKDETIYIFKKMSTKTNFFELWSPFAITKNLRGGQFFAVELNVREFVEEDDPWMESESVSISGFSFAIYANQIKQSSSEENNPQKHLGIYLACKGTPSDVSNKWSCEAAYQLILVAKAPNQEDRIRIASHRFAETGNSWDNWGVPQFISIEELLDPKNGWVENDSVTVKAKIQVLERGDFDDAENEAEKEVDDGPSNKE